MASANKKDNEVAALMLTDEVGKFVAWVEVKTSALDMKMAMHELQRF